MQQSNIRSQIASNPNSDVMRLGSVQIIIYIIFRGNVNSSQDSEFQSVLYSSSPYDYDIDSEDLNEDSQRKTNNSVGMKESYSAEGTFLDLQ